MQRIYIALTLALALSCATAAFTTNGFVKNPVVVITDGTANYTTDKSLTLVSTNAGEISLIASNYTQSTVATNSSAGNYNVWLKKLDTKALTVSQNNSATVGGSFGASGYGNGYAFNLAADNETGTPQMRVYQSPLTGAGALGRLTIGNNTNTTFTPSVQSYIQLGKNLYVFLKVADKTVNVTSFALGGAVSTTSFQFSNTFDTAGLGLTWGEALGSNTVLAVWLENAVLKSANVDVSKNTVTANSVSGWNTSYTCQGYSTDKKYYGEFCILLSSAKDVIQTYVRSNSSNLVPLSSYFTNATSQTLTVFPYGPYLTVVLNDGNGTNPTYSYEMWDLEKLAIASINNVNKTRTIFANYDTATTSYFYGRVPAGGVYVGFAARPTAPATNVAPISVGLFLSGSYLASVLGFIMTIIAGLFLF